MAGNDGKILVADLPMMYPSDFLRFEKEGGVWGRQWYVRRKQLTFALTTATLSTALGSMYIISRRNTRLVLFSTFAGFTILGFCIGSALSSIIYTNVASNKETSMMRRVWWAKECAKNWDYSQVNEGMWKAKYPHATFPKKAWE
ncbi:hypothetical protein TraAM80_07134 [Trypanosoma rangeli]|uniref:Uncharacterized protein n=1 Tax=Trypanosoma rangeli TaxID=5698 RepID=A0A3S5IQM8_TRYRA|nr:uncharacterized protein TraAM80_07134 [Trypanosoma rangeli]RNF01233.1 hypothetical protein TraAM80_07134 [Trypanosoma rangeli]|eukprot:RNF01233.1 hypothetical protein TraAM80_07134 [Trypanosoma rangeli]